MKTIISLLVLFFPYITHALVFTEVMYNPEGSDSGYEWVEVYNDSDSTIDIFGWKFGDKGSPNHAIYEPSHASHPGKGTTTIAPGEYMVIASNATNFLSVFPGVGSSVLDTVMSLVNSGTEISLRKESGGTAIIAHTYTPQEGAENTGNSLQRKSDGAWIVAKPTPGEKTKEEVSTTSGGMPAEEVEVRTQTMIADILIPEQIRVSVPFEGEIEVYGYRGEYRSGGLFRIVFGDGTEHTQEKPGEFTHTYIHPRNLCTCF